MNRLKNYWRPDESPDQSNDSTPQAPEGRPPYWTVYPEQKDQEYFYPAVEVTPISAEVAEAILAHANQDINDVREAASPAAQTETLIIAHQAGAENIYHLRWTGGKVPRGAILGGQVIGATQHGIVYGGDSRTHIGYYERVKGSSGPNEDEHEMIVFMTPNHAPSSASAG